MQSIFWALAICWAHTFYILLCSLEVSKVALPCSFFTSVWNMFINGSDGKASAYNAGDPDSIPSSGRSPGEGNGNPLQYSCLENPMDEGAWWATVHGVANSWTRLNDFTFTFILLQFSSVQSLSRVRLFVTPWIPVHHQLLEFTQTHVHWVGDAIQPSHPLSSPSSPAPNPS